MSELKQQGVFAKEVRSAGVAFHSYYMASIAPALLAALKKVRSAARPVRARSCRRDTVTGNWCRLLLNINELPSCHCR